MKLTFDAMSLFIGIILAIVEMYIISNILEKKIFNSKIRLIIGIIILALYQSVAYSITVSFLRPIISLITIFIVAKFIFKEKITKTFISAFLTWMILLLSEILFMIIVTGVMKFNSEEIQSQILGKLFVNLIIYTIAIILTHIKFIKQLCNKICKKFCDIEDKFTTALILLLVFAFSIGTYLIYFSVTPFFAFIMNLIIMIIYGVLLITLFNEKSMNIKMQHNIDSISKNLNEYEQMLDYQRVANHENKNQLLVIKGKIRKNETDIIEYIDSIIMDERKDNEEFYEHTKRIPTGGLQGLIYYKSLLIRDNNILLDLKINRNIKNFDFNGLSALENDYLCKIVGIWLDNAIQAVEALEYKKIGVEMYYNNSQLNIYISNTFIGDIDVNKIQEKGYTTKGKGHGYGLYLVKKIIDENKRFNNTIYIHGNLFSQKLCIK